MASIDRISIPGEKASAGRGGESGFTLLELAMYSAVFIVLGAVMTATVVVSTRSITESNAFAKAQESNRVLLYRIEKDLREAMGATLSVTNVGRTLRFALPGGYDGVTVSVGSIIEFELQISPEERENGADDNGDGLIDEGILVRRDAATNETIVIRSGIDLANSSFALNGTGVTVSIANMAALKESTFDVASSVTIYPMN